MVCKCGHSKWQHINRLGKARGPCCAEKKTLLRSMTPEDRQKVLAVMPQGKRYRAIKVGKLISKCNCLIYQESGDE